MRFIQSIFNLLRFNRKNWKAVSLCIFAATIFWCFNALNKSYTTNINFPLVFDYDQEKYMPVRPLPQIVRFNVQGVGWNLFRRSAGFKVPPLVLPLPQPGEVRKIVGSTVPALLANQPEGFKINFVLTDTLHVVLEPKITRWINLKVDAPSILFRKGYGLISDINVEPDSVFIEGPMNLIRSLPDPLFLKISERNIDESFSEDVEVKFLNNELIKRDPPTVAVNFQVDNFIEIKDSVKLAVANPPKNAWPFIEGKELSCTIAVPESAMDKFSPDSLRAVINLQNVTKGKRKVLPILTGLPPYTRIVKLDSVTIKF
jgi:hypothetical protein